MSRLKELLDALSTVIVSYHDKRAPALPDKKSETTEDTALAAQALAEKPPEASVLPIPEIKIKTLEELTKIAQALTDKPIKEMREALTNLIDASTKSIETRKPLLMYVLHNICLLKSLVDPQSLIDEVALADINKQVQQLIIDLQILLNTSQSSTITLKYNNQNETVYGLTMPMWRGGFTLWTGPSLCISGQIIKQTLFETALKLPVTADLEIIQQTIGSMFTEYTLLSEVTTLRDALEQAKQETLEANEKARQAAQRQPTLTKPPKEPRYPINKQPMMLDEATLLQRARSSDAIDLTSRPQARHTPPRNYSFLTALAEGLGFIDSSDQTDAADRNSWNSKYK